MNIDLAIKHNARVVLAALSLVALGGVVSARPQAPRVGAPDSAAPNEAHARDVPAPTPPRAARRVAGVGITVSDLDRATEFFTGVLSFQALDEREESGEGVERVTGVFGVRSRTRALRLGDERVELTQYLAPEGRPIPHDARSNDRAFQHIAIVVSDMDAAYAHLRRHRVRHASPGPQTLPAWNTNAAGIKAFYFKDLDGHVLEVIQFPPGKGDPRWRRLTDEQPGRLFLGIDHTAIVVRDTEASLGFYRDRLGLRVAGGSENYGPEQERLNNVFGARLRITTLKAESGPGVELLEYLAPANGRHYPLDAAPNDLVHFHTLVVGDAEAFVSAARAAGGRAISAGAIDPDGPGPQPAQAMARDPDGHPILVLQAAPDQPSVHANGSVP